MAAKKMVSVDCNRRGSVSAGPLTLKPGTNVVGEKEFKAFQKTKLGAALVNQKLVTYTPEPVTPLEPDPPKQEDPSNEGDDAATKSEEEAEDPAAPSLAFDDEKEAVEYVSMLDDEEELFACYTEDKRDAVKEACSKRAEALSKRAEDKDKAKSGE